MPFARYWFVDDSGSNAYTQVRVRSFSDVPVLALGDALQSASSAGLYRIDLYQRYPYDGYNPPISLPTIHQVALETSDPVDVFHMWFPAIDSLSANDVSLLLQFPFCDSNGNNIVQPGSYSDPFEAIPLYPYNPGASYVGEYRVIVLREPYWQELLRQMRMLYSLSLREQDRSFAARIRRDIYELRGINLQEILNRLDTIINLLQQQGSESDELEELLAQLILAIGAP